MHFIAHYLRKNTRVVNLLVFRVMRDAIVKVVVVILEDVTLKFHGMVCFQDVS